MIRHLTALIPIAFVVAGACSSPSGAGERERASAGGSSAAGGSGGSAGINLGGSSNGGSGNRRAEANGVRKSAGAAGGEVTTDTCLERKPLSPRGRGLRRLSERSDPRVVRARGRSWVRGPRRPRTNVRIRGREARSAEALRSQSGALASARTSRCATPHPASPKLGSASLRLRILLPQGEKGGLMRGKGQ